MTPRLKRIADKICPEIPSSHVFRANLPPRLRGLARRVDETVSLNAELGAIQSNTGSNPAPGCPAGAGPPSETFASPLAHTTRTNILTSEQSSTASKISRPKFKLKSAKKSTTTKTPKQKLVQPPPPGAAPTPAKLRAKAQIEERKRLLLTHPWLVPSSLTPTQAQCARCGHIQQLDKRRLYGYSNMTQHWERESCKRAAASRMEGAAQGEPQVE
jgi:hypothetical protein